MAKNFLMVGDDGSVYHIKASDLGKVATKVPKENLSEDVQAHLNEATGGSCSGSGDAVSHIIATKSDIIVSSKADIIVAGESDIITHSKANIIVSE